MMKRGNWGKFRYLESCSFLRHVKEVRSASSTTQVERTTMQVNARCLYTNINLKHKKDKGGHELASFSILGKNPEE